jgi:hypothetical protein
MVRDSYNSITKFFSDYEYVNNSYVESPNTVIPALPDWQAGCPEFKIYHN